MLHISDAMARDIDSGKAAGRDVADFLPDDMAQQLYDMSSPGPVHAENLIPISARQGEDMRRIDPASGSLPKMPATRRVIPAPFKRDRVTGGSHGKKWLLVTAGKVMPGDIITDLGLVTEIEHKLRYTDVADFAEGGAAGPWAADDKVPSGMDVTVTGAGGKAVTWDAGHEVQVFR